MKKLLIATGIMAAGFAFADVITVPGYSFENPSVNSTFTGAVDPAWTIVEHHANGAATVRNDFSDTDVDTTEGIKYLSLANRDGNASNTTRVYQMILDGTVEANKDYTLTVAMLNRNMTSVTPAFRIGLYEDAAMTTVLAEKSQADITLSDTAWNDFSVTWNSGAGGAGKSLYIGFENSEATGVNQALGIDNVRLSVIPEPATLALFFISGAGVLMARCRMMH